MLAAKRKCAGEVGAGFQRSDMKAPTSMKRLCESEEADSISTSSMESVDDTKLIDDGPGHSEECGVQVCPLTVTLTEHLVTV